MRGLEMTGASDMLVLLLTFALVVGGFICFAVRVPRWIAVLLLLASALPLVVGAAGMALARIEMEQVLATLKAPVPKDRAWGEYESRIHLLVGLGGALIAYAVSLPALARSGPRLRAESEE